MNRSPLILTLVLAGGCFHDDGPPGLTTTGGGTGADVCGNGVRDPGEQCDGNDFGDLSCADFTSPYEVPYDGGKLGCTATCTAINSFCTVCGDGELEGAEVCDGDELNGESCSSLYGAPGDLACTNACTYDASDCQSGSTCGDGQQDDEEQCDGADLDGESCESLGFDGGALQCSRTCEYDTSQCSGCGDGALDPGEVCDGDELAGQTCQSIDPLYEGGTLACDEDCQDYDVSGCQAPNPISQCATGLPANYSNGSFVESDIVIDAPGLVSDITVTMTGEHNRLEDFRAELRHGPLDVLLVHQECGDYDDFDVVFNDGAAQDVGDNCGVPGLNGTLRPEQLLGFYQGVEISGTWTLRIEDLGVYTGDGELQSWCIDIVWI